MNCLNKYNICPNYLIAYAPSQNITKENYQIYSGPVLLDLHNSTLCVVVLPLFCLVFNVDSSLIYQNPGSNKLTFFYFVSFTKFILCKNKSFSVCFNFFVIKEFLKLFFLVSLVCLIPLTDSQGLISTEYRVNKSDELCYLTNIWPLIFLILTWFNNCSTPVEGDSFVWLSNTETSLFLSNYIWNRCGSISREEVFI